MDVWYHSTFLWAERPRKGEQERGTYKISPSYYRFHFIFDSAWHAFQIHFMNAWPEHSCKLTFYISRRNNSIINFLAVLWMFEGDNEVHSPNFVLPLFCCFYSKASAVLSFGGALRQNVSSKAPKIPLNDPERKNKYATTHFSVVDISYIKDYLIIREDEIAIAHVQFFI